MRVRTAKGRPAASTRWLARQLNDPYVRAARAAGYRSRAAYKLAEIDDRHGLLRPGRRVLDLGAAPGGWTQVAVERVRPAETGGRVVAVDRVPIEAIAGALILALDVGADDAGARLATALGGPADLVLSDMAPAATGHAGTDHLRLAALVERAAALAEAVLGPGGDFVAKVSRGGTEGALLAALKRRFRSVRHVKPPASRADSAEMYLVARGFRGTD